MEKDLKLADDIGFIDSEQLNGTVGSINYNPTRFLGASPTIQYIDNYNPYVVKFKKLHPKAEIPAYKTPGAAGMDLVALIQDDYGNDDFIQLAPGQRYLFSTGLAVELPANTVGYIHARSGLAVKQGISVVNGVGVCDTDYRGEVKVGLINLSNDYGWIKHGDRIAQFVVVPVCQCVIEESTELSDTVRGGGAFGHTGK